MSSMHLVCNPVNYCLYLNFIVAPLYVIHRVILLVKTASQEVDNLRFLNCVTYFFFCICLPLDSLRILEFAAAQYKGKIVCCVILKNTAAKHSTTVLIMCAMQDYWKTQKQKQKHNKKKMMKRKWNCFEMSPIDWIKCFAISWTKPLTMFHHFLAPYIW